MDHKFYTACTKICWMAPKGQIQRCVINTLKLSATNPCGSVANNRRVTDDLTREKLTFEGTGEVLM